MSNIFCKALDCLNEGIVIINEKLEICYWNSFMELITNLSLEQVEGKNIFVVLPNLNTNYFKKSANDLFKSGNKIFFSAAMHKHLVNDNIELNLNLSLINNGEEESKYLLLEFINVTSQFLQINKLKQYINELIELNKQLKEKEKIIENLAYYDNLTGVSNRTLFYKIAGNMLENAKRSNSKMCLMFIDVDKFKSINDNYGHEAGDKVIVRVSEILKNAVRKNDIVARYGGDEFLVLLPQIKSFDDHKAVISRIADNKNDIIKLEGNAIKISLSIGVSFYPDDGDNLDKLITKADKEMYISKRQTTNREN
ncbi:diguanylate cyclase domain-containing protein [Sedimentibacter sp.]|uniref:GGDEF domain-containing protein n=1 Tax=Sedimentibacter sp. TaxID=1960295 RepID=UPI0028ACE464|nr:diguanylate cyclase [Sedimentibacter sp.]